ncbi:MAG TPA: VgrG-related protein [Pseudonocardiaceae bacterium]|nr:VgrG-related protein [Pseudonocardiaceae bacterium]
MPAKEFTNQLIVEVAGKALPTDVAGLLVQGVMDDSRVLPDLFELRFRDRDHIVLDKASIKIGLPVKLSVVSNENNTPLPLLEGEITALEKEFDGTGTFTVVRGLDKSHRLTRGRRVASFHQMTVSDVVRKVAQGAKIPCGKIDPTSGVHKQISQGNLTDWAFLRQLAADVGAGIAMVDGKLEFRCPNAANAAPSTATSATEDAMVLELGRNVLRMRAVVTSAEQVPTVEVRGWDPTTKKAVVGQAPTKTVSAELGAKPAELASVFESQPLVATDSPYRTQGEVKDAAKALAEQVAGGFAELEVVMRGNPKVRAGTAVTLSGVGAPFEGKYTVSASRHVFDPEIGYTTRVMVSGAQDRTLLGLTGSRLGAATGGSGVVIGVVSDCRDPEKQGRVRLTFPWLNDTYVSDWARTVQPGAGKDRGAVIVPEVNDEVLVAFEQGSFQRPYVLGGLHNGVDTLPKGDVELVNSSAGTIDRRAFVSRTGHALEMLENASGAQGIKIRTGDGKLFLDLDQKKTKITVHSDGTVTVEAKQGVTVDAGTGSLRLTGQDVSIEGKTGVKVDGGGGEVKVSSSKVSVQGAMVSVNGSASTEVKGGAMCTIQAAIVKIN